MLNILILTYLHIQDNTWKRHRRIAGPSMHRRYLSRMAVHVSAGANGLVNLWKKKIQLAKDCAFETGFDIQLATMVRVGIRSSVFLLELKAYTLIRIR